MSRRADYRLFWQEFRRTFHSTGAVLPSGAALCAELARYAAAEGDRPRKLLEVGPGTGVATDAILARMGAADTLDLVELNERFVALLRERLATEPAWQVAAPRVRIHAMPIEQLAAADRYDAIVSGLPLNNFTGEVVASILAKLQALAAPRGTISFFEYVAVRKVKSLLCRRDERRRLADVEAALAPVLANREFHRRCIFTNIPPAWVHHLRIG